MRRRDREARDSGASSMEWAVLTPVLLLAITFVMQFAMVYHARHVALAAAQSGARVARSQRTGDWHGNAVSKATDAFNAIGPRLFQGPPQVTAGETPDHKNRWVVVSGEAIHILPGISFSVSQRAEGPIECFRPDSGDGTTCQGLP
jgi:hypothetical protein